MAVDGALSPGNSGFFHSNLELYPWLRVDFVEEDLETKYEKKPITLRRVQVYQRCDAHELYHRTNYQIHGDEMKDKDTVYDVSPKPLSGGRICATTSQMFSTGGMVFKNKF